MATSVDDPLEVFRLVEEKRLEFDDIGPFLAVFNALTQKLGLSAADLVALGLKLGRHVADDDRWMEIPQPTYDEAVRHLKRRFGEAQQ